VSSPLSTCVMYLRAVYTRDGVE